MVNTTTLIEKDIRQIASNIKIPKYVPSTKFPSDVIKYMKKNAILKQTVKLMKLNKFFLQEKFELFYLGDKTSVYQLNNNSVRISVNGENHYSIDELPNILGVSRYLLIYTDNVLPRLISKIIICDLKYLLLTLLRISFNDFKFLTSSVNFKKLLLNRAIVFSKNDEIVPYECLLDHVPYLQELRLSHILSSEISKVFIEKICSSNMKKLAFSDIDEKFEFESILASLKKKPNLDVHLSFHNPELVLERIDKYVDKLLASGLTKFCPPSFGFFYPKTTRYDSYKNLRKSYFESVH
uniref:Uncharacterized protein n=1 Tax=Panagrolaimus davidi TaxID=227884 RepID=A0A914QTT3_9BILA